MKRYLKALRAGIDLVLNDINYSGESIGYLGTQCPLKRPVRSEVTILS